MRPHGRPTTAKAYGFGWRKDPYDQRDWRYAPPPGAGKLPVRVDLRPFCPPVYNQKSLNSCSANAIAATVEFDLMKEKHERVIFPSRLFLFYNSRAMERTERSDNGVYIRDAVKALALHGDCPENLWPYVEKKFATRPPRECYDKALKYRAVEYYRIHRKLADLRACLASGYPFVFGFSAHEKFRDVVKKTGRLEMPAPHEGVIGKHAVLAVGYDDPERRLIVRNSWGAKFGRGGYFTMPYGYLEKEDLSADFWTVRVVS
ncbi:MAG TPA: C1 family peptidase [Nitrososphaerales archaeon]|nr:C1 family peptidase [Nitrososphaerales archaeon]